MWFILRILWTLLKWSVFSAVVTYTTSSFPAVRFIASDVIRNQTCSYLPAPLRTHLCAEPAKQPESRFRESILDLQSKFQNLTENAGRSSSLRQYVQQLGALQTVLKESVHSLVVSTGAVLQKNPNLQNQLQEFKGRVRSVSEKYQDLRMQVVKRANRHSAVLTTMGTTLDALLDSGTIQNSKLFKLLESHFRTKVDTLVKDLHVTHEQHNSVTEHVKELVSEAALLQQAYQSVMAAEAVDKARLDLNAAGYQDAARTAHAISAFASVFAALAATGVTGVPVALPAAAVAAVGGFTGGQVLRATSNNYKLHSESAHRELGALEERMTALAGVEVGLDMVVQRMQKEEEAFVELAECVDAVGEQYMELEQAVARGMGWEGVMRFVKATREGIRSVLALYGSLWKPILQSCLTPSAKPSIEEAEQEGLQYERVTVKTVAEAEELGLHHEGVVVEVEEEEEVPAQLPERTPGEDLLARMPCEDLLPPG